MTPVRERILGKEPDAVVVKEGQYSNAVEYDAIASELVKLGISSPEVSPHSCVHCRDFEIDLRIFGAREGKVTGERRRRGVRSLLSEWKGVTLAVAESKAALGCPFFQKLVTQRPLSAVAPEVAEEGCSVSMGAVFDDHPSIQFNWRGGRYDGLYYMYAVPGKPSSRSVLLDTY